MPKHEITATTVVDGFAAFPQGMNAGIAPQLLPKEQAAYAADVTFRGDFPTNRPPYQILNIDYSGAWDGSGLFQDAAVYRPDFGPESIIALIGGRLIQFFPQSNTANVSDISIPNDLNNAFVSQAWLWQSENYMIVQNGSDIPIFYDGNTSRRAAKGQAIATISSTAGDSQAVSAIGLTFTVGLTAQYTGPLNISIEMLSQTGQNLGVFTLVTPQSTGGGYAVSLTTVTAQKPSQPIDSAVIVKRDWSGVTTNTKVINLYPGTGNAKAIPVSPAYNGAAGDQVQLTAANGARVLTVTSVSTDGLSITCSWAGDGHVGDYIIIKAGMAMVKLNPGAPTTLGTLVQAFSTPGIGIAGNAIMSAPYTGMAGATVYINGDQFTIGPAKNTSGKPTVTLLNISGTQNTQPAAFVGGTLNQLPELPVGKQGAYVLGRNWMALPSGNSYIASDEVGEQSGTPALGYRDAVLRITDNSTLAQGGSFSVPGSVGDIRSINAAPTLDASLGQGPVQVGTPFSFFSCTADQIPGNLWVSQTNPIQTQSLIGYGPLSQSGVAISNSDLFFRSSIGICSLILARREFSTWGNTSQSHELEPVLSEDNPSLLAYCSAITFDNRLLCTTGLVTGPQGVYGTNIAALNFDPITSLRGKLPAIYDGVWSGLNVLKFVTGTFNGIIRAFAFTYNTTARRIELHELLSSGSGLASDNGTDQIQFSFDTPILLAKVDGKQHNDLCRLTTGELYVRDLVDDTTFSVYFRADYDQNWHLWSQWTVPKGATYQPRMGFGDTPLDGDESTGRPWNTGYSFQVRVTVKGACTVMGGRVGAQVVPTSAFAPLYGNITQ